MSNQPIEEEIQLFKDLRKMAHDIGVIAKILAHTINFTAPMTDEGVKQLTIYQGMLKTIYERKINE